MEFGKPFGVSPVTKSGKAQYMIMSNNKIDILKHNYSTSGKFNISPLMFSSIGVVLWYISDAVDICIR